LIPVSNKIFEYLSSIYGEAPAKKYIEFINEEPTQYLRANTLKTSREELSANLLKEYEINTAPVNRIESALKVLDSKKIIGKTIEHIIGEYYIQGLSSMIPPLILDPKPGDTVLDLCAAPGSKTTELAELMNNRGTLVANEIQLNRVKMLVYNLDRMNIANAGVIHTKGEWLSKHYSGHFDKILVDAPCSGLGIIQKKEEVSDWWSIERAGKLGDLQLRLLIAAIKMAKIGGEIVYSTCTLTIEENELIMNKVLDKYPVEIMEINLPIKSHPAFTNYRGIKLNPELSKTKRILPWEADTDGFFVVKLQKTGDTISPEQTIPRQKYTKFFGINDRELKPLIKNLIDEFQLPEEKLSEYKYLVKGNDIFIISREWNDPFPGHFQRIGTKLGVKDKNNRLSLHTQGAQLFHKHIKNNIYEITELDHLKKYLEGGVIRIENKTEGQCIIKYKNYILGTAIITKTGIKSRFPRAKRTQEIYTDF
jgi:16S rRNA (cytosine1407-C5)-methyltransferase